MLGDAGRVLVEEHRDLEVGGDALASCCAVSMQTGVSSERSGTNGTTSVAPKRGCAPSCWLRSMSSAAFLTARKAASAIGPS